MASSDQVLTYFATRRTKKTTNSVEWSNGRGNLYCTGRVLYSYGSHWPLAVYAGRLNGSPVFIKNGDRYSATTAGHTAGTQHACKGPTVSVRSVEAAGVDFLQIALKPGEGRTMPEEFLAVGQTEPLTELPQELVERWKGSITYILFWQEDSRQELIYDRKTKEYYTEFERRYKDTDNEDYSKRDYTVTGYRIKRTSKFTVPAQGMFIKNRKQSSERYVEGHWHILGAVVLEHHAVRTEQVEDKRCRYGYRTVEHPPEVSYLLCSLDEGSYFVAKLPVQPTSVKHAFDCLKPEVVNTALNEGKEVKRQGEWFFVPYKNDRELAAELGITIKALNERAKAEALPVVADNSNQHVAKLVKVGEKVLAKGSVRHRFPFGGRTGQHRTVQLDVWHEVHRNTELASWSGLTGRVD